MIDKIEIINQVATKILHSKLQDAEELIRKDFPFNKTVVQKRTYSDIEKMKIFIRDGFVDRYSGERLVNPGLLKVLSNYMPEAFPYHSHWKMDECHNAYWELIPTVDHIYPIALGGEDSISNCVTTSMLHNSIKSSWTLEQLNWKLYGLDDCNKYDGLTDLFMQLVNADKNLLNDPYIKRWYRLSENEQEALSHLKVNVK